MSGSWDLASAAAAGAHSRLLCRSNQHMHPQRQTEIPAEKAGCETVVCVLCEDTLYKQFLQGSRLAPHAPSLPGWHIFLSVLSEAYGGADLLQTIAAACFLCLMQNINMQLLTDVCLQWQPLTLQQSSNQHVKLKMSAHRPLSDLSQAAALLT